MAQKHRIFDPPQIRPHPKSLALGPLGDTTQRVETKLRPNWSRKGDIGLLVFYLQTALESLAGQETGKTQQVRIEPAICPVSRILVTARGVVSAVFR